MGETTAREISVADDQQSWWRRLQVRLRKKRFAFFVSLLSTLPRPLSILDVGGTPEFWQTMEFCDRDVTIIVYNLTRIETSYPGLVSMAGDARSMREFADQQFDVVFSNSVIEHVGSYEQQHAMAQEIQRVGKRYYVQTPNRSFPIEPHVLLPLFQFLPHGLQVFILSHFRSPWGWKIDNSQEAEIYIQAIRLLTAKELHAFFPKAQMYREKVWGLTKSFMMCEGW